VDRKLSKSAICIIAVPLVLSTFTHIWNPIGFPPLEYDEGTYSGRAMHLLIGQGPQEESSNYDHPYFGQLFLAFMLWITGYPGSLHLSNNGDVHSIEMLWLVPRVLMGLLAVVDTFLIYKIAEYRYNRKVGLVASILFAVMPITWLTRGILLDSILLPFLLSSILFSVFYIKISMNDNRYKNRKFLVILLSGIFMGIAIFTKIPAFTMIPMVAFLILSADTKRDKNLAHVMQRRIALHDYRNNIKKNLKILGLWFIPVILIPAIWPAYAVSSGHLEDWLYGIYFQTHRESKPLVGTIKDFFKIDPILMIIGTAGFIFAFTRRDVLTLLWIIPLGIFLYFINFASLYFWIPILPAFCISAAVMINYMSNKVPYKKLRQPLLFAVISAIAIFGLISTVSVISRYVNSTFFEAPAFLVQFLQHDNHSANNYKYKTSMITTPLYLWLFKYIFAPKIDYCFYCYDLATNTKNKKVIYLVDKKFMSALSDNDPDDEQLRKIYNLYLTNQTTTIEAGPVKNDTVIILPNLGNTRQSKIINLIDQNHIWKHVNYAKVFQQNGSLNITVNTRKSGEVFNRAALQTQVNLTKKPLLLSFNYASKSIEGKAKFYIEVRDKNRANVFWYFLLSNTFGKTITERYILPSTIVDRAIEFRIYLTTNGPGEHDLIVKNASIV
jgi:Dolichyl-phosphate-mannose-protein mannosyltransferase